MSSQIQINYEAVYSRVSELRTRIQTELQETETAYHQIRPTLNSMDSRTNTIYTQAMAENQTKARLTSATLCKLLLFIETTAKEVERHDQMLARMFKFPGSRRV